MSDTSKTQNTPAGGKSDPLVDSLLRQFADTNGKADEDFLAQVENAIDESEKIVPISKALRWRKSLAWASGIAAVIAVGLGAWFTTVPYGKSGENVDVLAANTGEEEGPTVIVATNAMSSSDSIGGITFNDIRLNPGADLSIVQAPEILSGVIKFGDSESKIDSTTDFVEITERRWTIGAPSGDRIATSISGLGPVKGNIDVLPEIGTLKSGILSFDGSTSSGRLYAQVGAGGYDSDPSKKADINIISTGSVIVESGDGKRTNGPQVIDFSEGTNSQSWGSNSNATASGSTVGGVAVSSDETGDVSVSYGGTDYQMKTSPQTTAAGSGAGSKTQTLTPIVGYNGSQLGHGQVGKIRVEGNPDTYERIIRRELPIAPGEKLDTTKVTVKTDNKPERGYVQVGVGGYSSRGVHSGRTKFTIPPVNAAKPSTVEIIVGGAVAFGAGGDIIVPEGGPITLVESLYPSADDMVMKPASPGLMTTVAPSKMMFGASFSQADIALASLTPSRPTGYGLTRNPIESRATRYGSLIDNAWTSPLKNPLSTFSIDVDTASWTNVRGMIRSGITAAQIPNDAVRIEEMINYFDWTYPQPKGDHPFAFAVEEAACPWNADNRLLRVGIQGMEIPKRKRPDANLVFLLDVSGSMNQPNKLPLVKKAISILVEELDENDSVTMVVYAGAEGVALPPTSGRKQATIAAALRKLNAGGSTNGGAGIKLAYKLAAEQFVEGGINRVILCTDGDFNVGLTGNDELVKMVERKAKSGVFLSVCGFGRDNLNDAMLEKITNKGNGNYFFIDTPREARKVFLKDMMGTLMTIAKDVKIQMEFNPAKVAAYRLIGYANRRLNAEDFENDKVDAGEVGSGHSVTALYEVILVGGENDPRSKVTSNLRYQKDVDPPKPKRETIPSNELALLKLRYKRPDEDVSILMEQAIMPSGTNIEAASKDYQFVSAVALFGLILREHESIKGQGIADVIKLAEKGKGNDPHGYRAEFVKLVRKLGEKEAREITLTVTPSQNPKQIRAVVNGEPITQAEVDAALQLNVRLYLLKNRGKANRSQVERRIREMESNALDDLIDRKLILSEYRRLGGEIRGKYIDGFISKFVDDHFGGDHDKFLIELKKSGITSSRFRDIQREKIVIQALSAQNVRNNFDLYPVTQSEEKRARELFKRRFNTDKIENRMKDMVLKDRRNKWIKKLRDDVNVKIYAKPKAGNQGGVSLDAKF